MTHSKDELLKAVSEVLDEAIATYEKLEKSFDNTEEIQDPSKPSLKKEDEEAPKMAAPFEPKEKEEEESEEEKEKKKKAQEESKETPAEEAKEHKEEDKKEDEDESDEKLMETYKSVCAKMEKKGLLKSETPAEEVQKSEAKVDDSKAEEIESLKKSFSDQIESLSKKMETISQTVEKFAKAPAAPRKGLSGATPLRKSEDEGKAVLSKTEALDKLLNLKKSGDQRIDTGLINRVETGRLTKYDYEKLNSILG